MFSFFKIPVFITLFYVSLNGLGYIISKLTFKKQIPYSNLYPLISFPIIFCLITYFHIFFKLYPILNLSILLFGFYFYIQNCKKIENIKLSLILLFLVTIQFIGHDVNEDFGYYHLPYVINFVSDKLILGLSNLSMVQGYNSAWLNISSFFYMPIFNDQTIHFANSVIYISILIFFINFIINEKNINQFPLSSLYALLAISFFIIKSSRLNSFGVDVSGHIYSTIVFFLFINFFEKNDLNFRKIIFYLILIFSLFSIFIKLSYLPLILIPIICLYIEKKIIEKKIFFIIIIFSLPWIVQQVAYTSCAVFPLNFTCIKNLPWYSASDVKGAAFSLEYINKSWSVYDGILTEKEYMKNFNWFKTWFYRNINELSDNLATFVLPILILFCTKLIKKYKSKKFILTNLYLNKFVKLSIIPISLGLMLWFFKAPVIRYGIFYINAFVFLIIIYLTRSLIINNLKKNIIYSILIFGILFNLTKNLNRIYNLNSYKEFPFPKVMKINFKTENIQDIKLNTPIGKKDHKSFLCWNVPKYCSIGGFGNLKVDTFGMYKIFIKK